MVLAKELGQHVVFKCRSWILTQVHLGTVSANQFNSVNIFIILLANFLISSPFPGVMKNIKSGNYRFISRQMFCSKSNLAMAIELKLNCQLYIW